MTTVSDDPRIGEQIEKVEENKKYDIVLIGFPFDEGVARNGGRVGAKEGPSTLRKLMKRVGTVLNPEFNIDVRNVKLGDLGDVGPENLSFEESHAELTKMVSYAMTNLAAIPFVVGGGNDQSYSNGLALLQHVNNKEQVAVMNIDAHLDVRPQKEGKEHSGSPFRLLLEKHNLFDGKNFVEFAAQGTQCSAIHADYVQKEHKGRIFWLSELKKNGVVKTFCKLLEEFPSNVFISFDIDAIQSSDCPGVSAPATIGLTSQEALDICFEAGKCSKVKLFDLSEFNPKIEDYRTAKLVANMFAYFVMGYATRKQ